MRKTICLFLLLIVLSSCSGEQAYEPVEINPDVDVCEVCNMSISSEKHATELFSKEGDVFKFDDIGCMIQYVEKDNRIDAKDIAKQYVRDWETGDWVEIQDAYFAYDPDYWTPMSYGVVSFATEEQAKEYMEEEGEGELMTYADLDDFDWGFGND